MNFRDYWRSIDKPARSRVADRAETSVEYLIQIAGGHSRPSAAMCVRLEIATGGKVTREELRPDLFLRQSA